MNMTVTQFKAKCLGIVEKVQREKCRVVITRSGKVAAQLVPIEESAGKSLFGRSSKQTEILGDLMSSGEMWNAED
jgi:prevent-host-death family protein